MNNIAGATKVVATAALFFASMHYDWTVWLQVSFFALLVAALLAVGEMPSFGGGNG